MAEEAQVEVSEKVIEHVRDIFRTLAITIKTFTIYPKDNPIYQKFATELFEKFSSFFDSDDQLSVDIEQYSLLYKGKSVYHSKERNDNVALLLFADGIRQIDFHKGITAEEITDFIDILRLASRLETKDDDDIVTLLWERNIKNMGYAAVEDTVDDSLAVEESLLSEGIDQKSSDEVNVGAASSPGAPIKSASVALEVETLSDNELDEIKNDLSALEEKPLLSAALKLLFDLLTNENGTEVFPEIMQNIGRIADIRMKEADIKGTIELLTDLKKYYAVLNAPEQQTLIDTVFDNAGTPDKITTLFSAAESPDIQRYLFLLRKNSIPHMISVLGELQEMKQRKLLCEILAVVCKYHMSALAEALTDDRWYLVRNLAMILGMTGEPAAVKHLGKVLTHPNMKVRREVVRALDNINTEDTKSLFLIALGDKDSTVRIRALKALKKFKDPAIFRRLRESASIEELKKKTFEETRELLETLAVNGAEDAFPVLSDLFRKRGLFEKEEITQIRACAAYGLGLIGTPESVALLENESESKKDILREACINALKESQKSGNIRR